MAKPPARPAAPRSHDAQRASAPPAYRQRAGYARALVTLTDSSTGRRRDYWLGPHDAPESRERYHRLIAHWESLGRRLPGPDWDAPPAETQAGLLVEDLVLAYFEWAQTYYRPQEWGTLRVALRLVRRMYGGTPAAAFGPQKLRLVREAMIRGDASEKPARAPWTRVYCNQQCRRVRAMFKWAASREMLPVAVHQALATVEPLKRGRTPAREGRKIAPAPLDLVDACRPFLSRQVTAMIDLQLLTGARSGEVAIMRPIDIDTTRRDGVWVYRPGSHKTEHLGRERAVYLGPKAQAVLGPFLTGRRVDQFLFSPAEAEAERRARATEARRTPLSCGNRVGTNRRERPARAPGDRYTTPSYYLAILRACRRAFEPPEALRPREVEPGRHETKREMLVRMTPKERDALEAWKTAHRWHPHQLRHNAGTAVRREFGLEAAQLVLGHSSAQITDAVYAERDGRTAAEAMRRIG